MESKGCASYVLDMVLVLKKFGITMGLTQIVINDFGDADPSGEHGLMLVIVPGQHACLSNIDSVGNCRHMLASAISTAGQYRHTDKWGCGGNC